MLHAPPSPRHFLRGNILPAALGGGQAALLLRALLRHAALRGAILSPPPWKRSGGAADVRPPTPCRYRQGHFLPAALVAVREAPLRALARPAALGGAILSPPSPPVVGRRCRRAPSLAAPLSAGPPSPRRLGRRSGGAAAVRPSSCCRSGGAIFSLPPWPAAGGADDACEAARHPLPRCSCARALRSRRRPLRRSRRSPRAHQASRGRLLPSTSRAARGRPPLHRTPGRTQRSRTARWLHPCRRGRRRGVCRATGSAPGRPGRVRHSAGARRRRGGPWPAHPPPHAEPYPAVA